MGKIIIGYPGIGKSTLAGIKNGYIDLESSMFSCDDTKVDHWAQIYVNVAVDLCLQGYTVFVSSHALVINELKKRKKSFEVIVVCPSIKLEKDWIKKLESRYFVSKNNNEPSTYKNYRAWNRSAGHYKEDIDSLMNCGFNCIVINDMTYDLTSLLSTKVME